MIPALKENGRILEVMITRVSKKRGQVVLKVKNLSQKMKAEKEEKEPDLKRKAVLNERKEVLNHQITHGLTEKETKVLKVMRSPVLEKKVVLNERKEVLNHQIARALTEKKVKVLKVEKAPVLKRKVVLNERKEVLNHQIAHDLIEKETKVLKVMRNQDLKSGVTLVVQGNLKNQKGSKETLMVLRAMKNQDDLTNLSMVIQERNVLMIEKKEVRGDLTNLIARKMTIESIIKKAKKHQDNYLMALFA